MTAPTDQSQFASAVAQTEGEVPFQALRGDFLDAFCELELAVSRWLNFLEEKPSTGAAFGKRLGDFAGHSALAERVGKKQLTQIRQLPEKLAGVLETRNSVVHGIRRFGILDGQPCVFIQNVNDAVLQKQTYVAMTEPEFRKSIAQVKTAASHLDNWLRQKLNQASSPPPPLPDAAGGP